MHSLRLDSGHALYTQSHKNIMTTQSLNVFLQIARNQDILDDTPLRKTAQIQPVMNSYLAGTEKLKAELGNNPTFNRFKLHMGTELGPGGDDDAEEGENILIEE